MGDVTTEPSMEDILSSIKRIIAEEGEGAVQARTRRAEPAPRAALPASKPAPVIEDEVLELSDPMPAPAPEPAMLTPADDAPSASPAPILSDSAAQATRGALDILSRLVVKPEPPSDGTLEGLVRDMLRPMLREWLDANLPAMVEQMVQREIAKITGAQR
ncbi:conserved hypothetical protein [Sphingomonas sp. EC-HK361]|uniref:DUF2497 domain-containing protein n=1 Tax=Sphingomonas sp. EC-HK361 TaxID=2038397 RepID=UPI00125C2300|nr:DUF2497 domain-containing protein [Sphingomonas sp. EC-HK361]VVT10361.1 conserved hypothetical protein [Sphingomonas sp. EC-HK361]